MKKIISLLFFVTFAPLCSMQYGAVTIFKKPDLQKPKPLIAYPNSKKSLIERYEVLKRSKNKGNNKTDVLIDFLVTYGQVACVKSCNNFSELNPFLGSSEIEKEFYKASLYKALVTSCATCQVLKSKAIPRVSISLAGGNSFVGPVVRYKDYMVADIPLAIKNFAQSHSLKKVLVIDENSEKDMCARVDYYLHGNGAIFYNDDTVSIFNDINIVVANQIPCLLFEDEQSDVISQLLLEKYLAAEENVHHKFDLAYYVVRLENLNIEAIEESSNKQLCNNRIYSLLDNHIPTVVVFSGDVEKNSLIAVNYMRNVFDYAQQVYNRYKQ